MSILDMTQNNLMLRLQIVEYHFIAIAPRSTLTWSGRTWEGPIYGSNRTVYFWWTELFEIELFICIKMDLLLNNQQRFIIYKTQTKLQVSLTIKSSLEIYQEHHFFFLHILSDTGGRGHQTLA